jgi:hypothetical protein
MSDPADPGPEYWGNNEPQYYTDRCEHSALDGLLVQGSWPSPSLDLREALL